MGESILAASNDEDKIGKGETAASVSSLEVSVSFGRFENDSLSWEKWSSFSPNKYLEEVEKCATPGSVAQKKAYFEAHYKKIAARKAELLDQEKQMEHDSLRSPDDQNNGDLLGITCETDSQFDVINGHDSAEEAKQEAKLDGDLGSDHVDEPNNDAAINIEDQSLSVGGEKEEPDSQLDNPTLNKLEESVLVKEEETPSVGSQYPKESPKSLEKEMESIPVIKGENVKLDHRKNSQKHTALSKVRDMARVKKKTVSPETKMPQISTPKVSRPVSNSISSTASRSSTKRVTGSLLPRSKNLSTEASKKVAPKSLHMSLTLDPRNSVPAPLTTPRETRQSFIMEKMGDKEIVKRAFKTFQNNFNQLKSSAEERSSGAKQMPSKVADVKVSTSMTLRKENGSPLKTSGVERKTAKAAPSSFGLKSDERAEKRKEFAKKLEEKSNAKEAESTRLQTKSKEGKEAEIKNLRWNLNFKATPMPGFYRGQKASKGPLDKVGSKTLKI